MIPFSVKGTRYHRAVPQRSTHVTLPHPQQQMTPDSLLQESGIGFEGLPVASLCGWPDNV